MAWKATAWLGSAFDEDNRYQTVTFLLCVLFGLAMIANVQTTNDGDWMWYALSLYSGQRLYADLHLALQPLFVLEAAAFLKLLGRGWLASKVPGVLHLIAYCAGLSLLARRSALPDRQKAVVAGCAFFVSICSFAYRFVDYHTPSDCLVLYSMLLLLMLRESASSRRAMGLVALLGALSGLAITLRINDGLALWFGVGLSIVCLTPAKRLLSVALLLLVAALIVVGVVHLTGDTFHDYLSYTLFKAVGGKGGTGNVLVNPLRLPWNALRYLRNPWYPGLIAYTVGAAAVWAFLLRPLGRVREPGEFKRDALGALLILAPLPYFYRGLLNPDLLLAMSTLGVFAIYGLGVFAFLRYLRWEISGRTWIWDSREILMITPLGQMISTAASSGGVHWGVYEPWAMLIVILPIASPVRLRSERARTALVGVGAILLVCSGFYRFLVPYAWHSTQPRAMFIGRQWYRHPVYGPMIIETSLLEFIEPICDRMGPDGAEAGLLSLPYSYANYFCDIPPWHGYVQTYYDTSTAETIFGLMDELQRAPPKWIFYERQLDSLAAHERQYNHGRPLPHRYLDEFLEEKLARGEWKAVFTSEYASTPLWKEQWILIQTRP
jgi:hypothetical protein